MTTFPATALGLKSELLLNGTWTDISQYLDHDHQDSQGHPAAVEIQRGRPDELTTSASPSQAVFKAWNGDGRFCTRNPTGAYYPYLTRNTKIRFSVPSATNYLRIPNADNSFAAASSPATITSDLEVQVELHPKDYSTACYIATKWDFTNGTQNSWALVLNPDATLTLFWSTTGSDFPSVKSAMPIPVGHIAIRVTLAVNASGSHVVTFYTGSSIAAANWTQLGDVIVLSGTTSVFNGTALYQTSAGTFTGSYFGMKVLNGIGGVAIASPDFTQAVVGLNTYTDPSLNLWTLNGTSEFSNRDYRFYGQLSALPTTWDPTGQDVWVELTASGALRRLQQGNQPNVMSAMRRAIQYKTGNAAPVVYWPMEDAASATMIAPAIGARRMFWQGHPQLSSGTPFACSNAIPSVNNGVFKANVLYPKSLTWQDAVARYLWSCPSSGETNGATVSRVKYASNGVIDHVDLLYGTGGTLTLSAYDNTGSPLGTTGAVSFGVNGQNMLVGINCKSSGLNTIVQVEVMVVGGATVFGAQTAQTAQFTVTSAQPVAITQVYLGSNGISSSNVGHLYVQAVWDSLFTLSSPYAANPLNAWNGENAGARFARICGENGIPARVTGGATRSVQMGYQTPDTLMNLLQACEDADRGQIFESRDAFGLNYRTLLSLCNQPAMVTLDYNLDHLTPPLEPTDDDQFTSNDVTATNTSSTFSGGSSFSGSQSTQTLNDGSPMSIGVIGDYANDYQVSVASDNQLDDEAGWILNVSTVDEERYPLVVVNLASTQAAVQAITTSTRGSDIGSHLQIINTPSFLPPGPIDQLVWGYTEYLGDFCDEMQFNCVPESPYEVAVAGDPIRAKADTPGSAIEVAAGSSDAVLQVGSKFSGLVGAYLNPTAMGVSTYAQAAAIWQGWTGITPPCTRVYLANSYPINADMTAMISAGVKMLISIQPDYNPVSSTTLATITTWLQNLKAAGANCVIALWSEPFFSGLTVNQYQTAYRYYGPTIRQYFPLACVFSTSSIKNQNEGSYYPGDAYVDQLTVDYYADGPSIGYTLDTTAKIAPTKPLGIWEFNGGTGTSGQTQAQITAFYQYISTYMGLRMQQGLINADLCLFNGAPGQSWLGASTTTNAGFEGGLGNWTSAGNSTLTQTNAQQHSGAGCMAITSVAAGNAQAASCTAANILTQGMPCTAGDVINGAAWFKAATTGRNCQVGIGFYTSAGVSISNLYGSNVADVTTGWTQVTSGAVTAPATSAFCRLLVQSLSDAAGAEVHWVDDCELRDVQSTSAQLTTTIEFPWDYRLPLWKAVYSAVEAGPGWTTNGTDFPFDIRTGGERATVTDINGPPTNFLTGNTASFEGTNGNWTSGTNCSISNVKTGSAHSGTHVMAMTSTAAGAMTAASCTVANIATQGLPCSPGDLVQAAAWTQDTTTPEFFQAQIAFYTAAGGLISTISGGLATNRTWFKYTVSGNAPATAAFCRLVMNGSAAAGGEVHWVDDAYLGNVTTGNGWQSFVVTRSVNGISKSHPVGDAVNLYQQATAALTG